MKHEHAEAFMVMTYQSDDKRDDERIWNSRDGVTPFVIILRNGKQARHVMWEMDSYEPEHKPEIGDRIFVDMTEERAKVLALEIADRDWESPNEEIKRMCRGMFDNKIHLYVDYLFTTFHKPGNPDLVEYLGVSE